MPSRTYVAVGFIFLSYTYSFEVVSEWYRSGIGVVTVLQRYCKGIVRVLYKPVINP